MFTKKFALILAVASSTAFASNSNSTNKDTTLFRAIKSQVCELEILKDFIFNKDEDVSVHGRLNIQLSGAESSVRRLKSGRVLKITNLRANDYAVAYFESEPAIFGAAINTPDGLRSFTQMTLEEIELYSKNSVKINCAAGDIIDL